MKQARRGRVDFHLHSHASNVTDYYAANAFSIPESYSKPWELYRLLRERGMQLITLTDHNSIDGGRELLSRGLPGVFLSSELTCTFPEDGCHLHVTVANMTEAQFAEANRLRANVYELVAWLRAERSRGVTGLGWFMTHPLMSTQNRPYGREGSLSVSHLEKCLLLFEHFEVQNGSRTRALNELTRGMLESLDAERLARLAQKHGLEPWGPEPWRKGLLGGSDDHAGINPGRTWTEFTYAGAKPTPEDLVDSLWRRETWPGGNYGGPITLAHSVLKLLYDGTQQSAAPAGRRVTVGGPIHSLLRLVFESDSVSLLEKTVLHARAALRKALAPMLHRRSRAGVPFEELLEAEVEALLGDATFRAKLEQETRTDDRIFLVVSTLLNRLFARYLDNLWGARGGNVVSLLRELVALVGSNLFVSLPYLLSFVQQSADSLVARDVRKAFGLLERQRVVLLTDTFFEVNGVSLSIKRMVREALRRGLDFTVVTCLGEHEWHRYESDPELRRWVELGRLKLFASVAQRDFPEYEDLQVRVPPFLEVLRYLQESGCTKVQLSTPGVLGLVGLAAAKALQIESAATYHTSIPEYIENYTQDVSLEALAWRYMILFYHSVDEVLVPSRYIARLLHKRGLRNRKLLILDRWVDLERFHPRNRTPGFWKRYGLEREEELVKFLYVGRLGVEKNLALVAEAYRKLRAERSDCHLVLVGDGPFREGLAKLLEGLPVTFTGMLEGQELARAVASADAKLFPSTTDTWGNAPLEAQSSGLPVVVSDVGGPCELMVDGVTGLVLRHRDAQSLCDAMRTLLDPTVRERLGRSAREFVEAHRVEEPFTAVLDAEAYRRSLARQEAQGLRGPRALELPHADNAHESASSEPL